MSTHLIVSHGEFTAHRYAYILGWLADYIESDPAIRAADDEVVRAEARLRDVLGAGRSRSPG